MYFVKLEYVVHVCRGDSWESYIFCLEVCVQCNIPWAVPMFRWWYIKCVHVKVSTDANVPFGCN